MVPLVDVACDQSGAVCVGARDENRRHSHHVSGQARRGEFLNSFLSWYKDFPAHVPTLLRRSELIFEVHGRGARFNHRLHQLIRIQTTAETWFRVGDDWRIPVDSISSFGVIDLIRAL